MAERMSAEALEVAARAVLHRRINPDFFEVKDGAWTLDHDKVVAEAAITAYLAALSNHIPDTGQMVPGSTGSAEGWQDELDGMPFGHDFLAENRFGDWLTVRRFDPKKPGDYSGNAVINGRTGRWWYPRRWRPLPAPPSPMIDAAGGRDE